MAERDTKIYVVTDTIASGATMLIRAKSKNAAINFAASAYLTAELATQDALIALIREGKPVIDPDESEQARAADTLSSFEG